MNIDKLQKDMLLKFETLGKSNSLSISKSTGIPQSTVYRSLYVKRIKLTEGISQLVNYLGMDISKYIDIDPSKNQDLMRALQIVWNGTDKHAKQLSRLLMTAHSCKIVSDQM